MDYEEGNHGPLARSKAGRFDVSVWNRKRFIASRNAFAGGREVEMTQICVQHSRYNPKARSWDNKRIWFKPEELDDLLNAIHRLKEDTLDEPIVTDD